MIIRHIPTTTIIPMKAIHQHPNLISVKVIQMKVCPIVRPTILLEVHSIAVFLRVPVVELPVQKVVRMERTVNTHQ